MRWIAIVLLALALTACGGGPGIPDTTYFRLPRRAETVPLPAPASELPVVVDTFLADGLHSDQAIIYSLDPQGARLRAYHYQLWVDPPVRMLQRRLIATLRAQQFAPLVADRLPSQTPSLRISARIERFERIRRGEGWVVAVALLLRADRPGGGGPVLLKFYETELPAAGTSVRDSVQVLGEGVDAIYAEFLADLAQMLQST